MIAEHGLGERRARKLLDIDRSSYRYEPQPEEDARLRQGLLELARQKPRFGYRRLRVLVERRGPKVNHKHLCRLYREEHLAVRRLKRRHVSRAAAPLASLSKAIQEWSMDFVSGGLATGRAMRTKPRRYNTPDPSTTCVAVLKRLRTGAAAGVGCWPKKGPTCSNENDFSFSVRRCSAWRRHPHLVRQPERGCPA
jgi:hypothetical protein